MGAVVLVVPAPATALELATLAALARRFRLARPANRQERIDGSDP
jgi:hypothetical protein